MTNHLNPLDGLTIKAVLDLVKEGFMHGFMGNTSTAYVTRQIAVAMEHQTELFYHNAGNLAQYCGWTRGQFETIAPKVGLKVIDADHLIVGFDLEYA